jgi:hypothetical protein
MSTEITQNVSNSQVSDTTSPQISEEDNTKINEFHTVVTAWITEIHEDFKNGNGYIKRVPQSICGEKFQELVEYILTKSPELANIRLHRRQVMTTKWQKARRLLYFIIESFLPVFISVASMYLLYMSMTTITNSYTTKTYSNISPTWMQTLDKIPNQLGSIIGKIISTTGSFGSSVVSSATGVPNLFGKINAAFVTSLVGYIIYRLSQPISMIVQESRKTIEKGETVCILQDEFEAEYKAVLAQSLYLLFIHPVMNAFDQLLHMSSKSASLAQHAHIIRVLHTYSENITILYYTFITQHEKAIRLMDPTDILRVSQPSTQFITLMTRLIRESNDELAQQYMLLNQSMLEAPHKMGQLFTLPTISPTAIQDTLTVVSSMRNMFM